MASSKDGTAIEFMRLSMGRSGNRSGTSTDIAIRTGPEQMCGETDHDIYLRLKACTRWYRCVGCMTSDFPPTDWITTAEAVECS